MESAQSPLPQEVRQRLDAAWRANAERLAEEWFGGWRRQAEEEIGAWLASALKDQVAELRRELVEQMTQDARGLRGAENHEAWMRVLLAAACRFSRFAVLFSTLNQRLRCEGLREADGGGDHPLVGLDIPLSAAPAFAHAVASLDPVTTVANAEELSESVAEQLAPLSSGSACLYPLVSRGRAVAVLYAEPGEDQAARASLEWLATVGGLSLEQRTAAPGELVEIAPPESPKATRWEALPKEERQLHLQAQRFAKWKASEIRLTHREAVGEGKKRRNLYAALRGEIDAARQEYRRRFMEQSPHMVDYLHIELVRTLANDDGALFGPEYPGPLV
jgi:hypothetical protein